MALLLARLDIPTITFAIPPAVASAAHGGSVYA
jgi:hypothetical protein